MTVTDYYIDNFPPDWANKKLIIFDLDGTLTESKKNLTPDMAGLLRQLLASKQVAVIGGGSYAQFQRQFLDYLEAEENELKNLFLFPTSATSFFVWENGDWKEVYRDTLSIDEKQKIRSAFDKIFERLSYKQPDRVYGELIEDRGSQMTFSALGQDAPLSEKEKWNREDDCRDDLMSALKEIIPEFEIRSGGHTSIDVTRKGVDKAYGIRQIVKHFDVGKEDLVFVGDALYEGGNDSAVKKEGVETLQVKSPEETKKFIDFILSAN